MSNTRDIIKRLTEFNIELNRIQFDIHNLEEPPYSGDMAAITNMLTNNSIYCDQTVQWLLAWGKTGKKGKL